MLDVVITLGLLARLRRRGLPAAIYNASTLTEAVIAAQAELDTEEARRYLEEAARIVADSPAYKRCLDDHPARGPCLLACLAYAAGADEAVAEKLREMNSAVVGAAMAAGARRAWRIQRDFKRLGKLLKKAVRECEKLGSG